MRKRGWQLLLSGCILLVLVGCASAPKRRNLALDAYSATPAGPEMYRIQYRGDATAASHERIVDFALAYASQLTADNGARYFAVIDEPKSTGGEIHYYADEIEIARKADPKALVVQIFPHRPKRILVFRAGHTAEVVYEKYGLNRRPEAM